MLFLVTSLTRSQIHMQGSPEARMSHFDQNGGDPQSGLSDKSSGQPLRSIQAFAEVGVIIIILLLYNIY